MNKLCLLLLVFVLGMSSALGVLNDSVIELKAGCVDAYGNVCVDSAGLIVVDSDNITVHNNTVCDDVALGIVNCKFQVNKTGVWFAHVNFTNQNITREYNVVVEADNMSNVWMIPVLLGMGLVMIAFYYISLKLNKEHVILAVFFFVMANANLTGLFYVMKVVSENSMVVTVMNWGMYIGIFTSVIVFLYFLLYLTWDGFKQIANQIRGMG